ncbi:adenylate/guanylate cyclase domain-containing protein [soil metagenome]
MLSCGVRCAACGFENPDDFRFCGSCGGSLTIACTDCGAEIPPGFRFCGFCGHPVTAVAPDATRQSSESTSEQLAASTPGTGGRRRVTILFADLVGFSTLAEDMDPEELRTLVTETFGRLTSRIEEREGRVEKFIGDAVVATFGATVAHEDDPDRAVATALSMLEEVQQGSGEVTAPLQLRIGINSGLVVSGGEADDGQTGIMGDAVNVAARLQQVAGPGEIVVSTPVWRRVRERYEAQHVGPVEVQGREQPIDAYRVIGPRKSSGRRQAPFVGRREELSLLELLWSSATKGNTHVVSLVGEPGVGKSRLLEEFAPRQDGRDLRIRCGSERAFGPFLDLMESLLGGSPSDVEDLTRRTGELGVEDDVAPLLAALLGLSGAPPAVALADEQRKRQVFSGVWQLLIATMRDRPALIVFDDVHWADRSSLDLLGFLLERLSGVPLVVVMAYRPGFEKVERSVLRASHTGIRLELLNWDESVALARGFLGVRRLPPDLERIVATRAEGNPFFIEELLQALLELGSLAVVEGEAVLAKVEVEIPDTVQGTILARVDRLAATERSVLQHAAVIGRNFSSDLIQAVMPGRDVASALEGLSAAQLILRQGPGGWTFKHALIQEVTYEALLLRHRRELHRLIAEALEARREGGGTALEVLAEHYARAEVLDKARAYALAAGDAAAERMGFVEARDLYERALRLWGEGDEEGRATLLMKLGWAALLTADSAAARTALIEAEAAWRAIGNKHQAGAALAMLGRVYFFSGESERGVEALRQAIDLLEPEGPSPELVRALTWTAIFNMISGRIEEGTELSERGLRIVEELGLEQARPHLLMSLGSFRVLRGDPAGVDQVRIGLDLAEAAEDVEAIGRAYVNLCLSLAELSQNSEGIAIARRGRDVTKKLGAPSFEWNIAGKEAEMLLELGRYEDAVDLCREILGPQRALMVAPALVWAGSYLCLALLRRGAFDEGRANLDEILPVARRIGGTMFLPTALLAEAELEEARSNRAAARHAVAEVLSIVVDTSAFTQQFRAVVPAARLLPRREVRPLLRRLRDRATHDAFRARLAEAQGIVEGDERRTREAATLYESLRLPYQEARCLIELGDLKAAAGILRRFGLEDGPLGQRVRERGER